jgi:hypothetical protein
MLMMEIKFIGLPFALARLALTLPAIILTGYVMEIVLQRKPRAEYSPGGKCLSFTGKKREKFLARDQCTKREQEIRNRPGSG